MATPNIKCNAVVQRIRWMVNIEWIILMVTIQINKLLSLKVKVWKETELTISSLSELRNFGPWYRIENWQIFVQHNGRWKDFAFLVR